MSAKDEARWTSHELARVLLDQPDLPVAIVSMGHSYLSDYHDKTHGPLQVRELTQGNAFAPRRYVVIGHMLDWELEKGDWKP